MSTKLSAQQLAIIKKARGIAKSLKSVTTPGLESVEYLDYLDSKSEGASSFLIKGKSADERSEVLQTATRLVRIRDSERKGLASLERATSGVAGLQDNILTLLSQISTLGVNKYIDNPAMSNIKHAFEAINSKFNINFAAINTTDVSENVGGAGDVYRYIAGQLSGLSASEKAAFNRKLDKVVKYKVMQDSLEKQLKSFQQGGIDYFKREFDFSEEEAAQVYDYMQGHILEDFATLGNRYNLSSDQVAETISYAAKNNVSYGRLGSLMKGYYDKGGYSLDDEDDIISVSFGSPEEQLDSFLGLLNS